MLKKRFGQHFLSDPAILRRIVRFADVNAGDSVIEIGPGSGNLTRELARNAREVIAIEIDGDLIDSLRADQPANVRIVHGDALETKLETFGCGPFAVVGNLPYNVATPLLKRFIAQRSVISKITVMVQLEVAERMVAGPASKAYGPLSVLIQNYAIPTMGFKVHPGAFRPPPRVDSAIIRMDWRPGVPDSAPFTDFVHRVFGSRRKKLVNNLLQVLSGRSREELLSEMAAAQIPAEARAENLSVEEFQRLYNRIRRS